MSYSRHEILVAPARRRTALWRVVVGLILVALGQAAAVALMLVLLPVVAPADWPQLMRDLAAPTRPVTTLMLLSTFFGAGWAVTVAARWLHKRTIGSLFGRAAVTLRHFVIGAAVTGAVIALSLAFWTGGYDADPGLDLSTWLLLLPLGLMAILVQTGAEELIFRGYLQSQMAARFASPLIWIGVPSLLFGMLHFSPDMAGSNAIWVVLGATVFGLVAADLTARTGSIGAAWGFHFANNTAAILILSTRGTIEGLALRLTPYSIDAPISPGLVAVDLAMIALVWWLIRRAVRV